MGQTFSPICSHFFSFATIYPTPNILYYEKLPLWRLFSRYLCTFPSSTTFSYIIQVSLYDIMGKRYKHLRKIQKRANILFYRRHFFLPFPHLYYIIENCYKYLRKVQRRAKICCYRIHFTPLPLLFFFRSSVTFFPPPAVWDDHQHSSNGEHEKCGKFFCAAENI